MSNKEWYHLPKGEYNTQFLKALAMAVHCKVIEPSELQHWFDTNRTQKDMTVDMYTRVKLVRIAL